LGNMRLEQLTSGLINHEILVVEQLFLVFHQILHCATTKDVKFLMTFLKVIYNKITKFLPNFHIIARTIIFIFNYCLRKFSGQNSGTQMFHYS